MKKGLWLGSFLFGAEQKLFKGKVPWTLHNDSAYDKLLPAAQGQPIALSQARWQADLRPPLVRVPQQHQPRGRASLTFH